MQHPSYDPSNVASVPLGEALNSGATHFHADYPGAPARRLQKDAARDARKAGVPKTNRFFGATIICYDRRCLENLGV